VVHARGYAHCEYVAYTAAARALFVSAGLSDKLGEGFVALTGKRDVDTFIKIARTLRLWTREPTTKTKNDSKLKSRSKSKPPRRTK
jgi:catalase